MAFEGPDCRNRAPGLASTSSILALRPPAEVSYRGFAARAEENRGISGGRFVEEGMLSQRECERPVTGCTEQLSALNYWLLVFPCRGCDWGMNKGNQIKRTRTKRLSSGEGVKQKEW